MGVLGYGKAWSYLEMEPTSSDEGDVITCYVDMPHKDAYYTETIAIKFCEFLFHIHSLEASENSFVNADTLLKNNKSGSDFEGAPRRTPRVRSDILYHCTINIFRVRA